MEPPNDGHRLPSLSYLLRLWASVIRGKVIWRASLEDPTTRRRVGFLSLDELASYLSEKAEALGAHVGEREGNECVLDRDEGKGTRGGSILTSRDSREANQPGGKAR